MSSTDKTRPLRVKLLDHPETLLQAEHRHGPDGACDLPARPSNPDAARHHEEWNGETTSCYWRSANTVRAIPALRPDVYVPRTTPAQRREDRRRERAQGKTDSAAGRADHEIAEGEYWADCVPAAAYPVGDEERADDEDYYSLARLTRLLGLPEGHHVIEATWDGMVTVMAPDGARSQVPASSIQDPHDALPVAIMVKPPRWRVQLAAERAAARAAERSAGGDPGHAGGLVVDVPSSAHGR